MSDKKTSFNPSLQTLERLKTDVLLGVDIDQMSAVVKYPKSARYSDTKIASVDVRVNKTAVATVASVFWLSTK